MSETSYNAEIIGIDEIPEDDFAKISAASLAGIIVKPPIAPAEAFYSAILGGPYGGIKHVITTREYTMFLAITREGDREQRTAYLQEIARKIGDYATNPMLVVAASAAMHRRTPGVD